MYYRSPYICVRRLSAALLMLCTTLLLLTSCGGAASGTITLTNGQPTLASEQVLTIPLIGTTNVPSFDPATELTASSKILFNMLYSGLVRTDDHLQPVPNQATWTISADQKQYTFHLKPDVTFGDGSAVTARSYVDSWTRAARPANTSAQISTLMYAIEGARELHSGQAKTLAGVHASDEHTLQVRLTKPAPYFLAALANPLFFPVNQKLISSYGEQLWPATAATQGLGSGPFVLKDVTPDVKMTLVPSPHYAGARPILKQVNVYFVNDSRVAYTANRAGRYDLVWDLSLQDQLPAAKLKGFLRPDKLQTDAFFFDTSKAPFDKLELRQAFAHALDKKAFALTVLHDAVSPAETLLPSAVPGYQAQPDTFNAAKARTLLKAAYPDVKQLPTITFTYPTSQVSPTITDALQSAWKKNLGIQVNLRPLEDQAYQQAVDSHSVQFGFASWQSTVADPYLFASRFLSSSDQNVSQWHNAAYDQLLARAESKTGSDRLALYQQAEQQLLSQAVIVPLDHPRLAALLPAWLRGVSVNADGLSFGDWSQVAILNHKA
ncbi:peptide ABC transporter substrate-binding protein [Dictyobacter vulcani]|uniref:Peptide ABC transporter substrate-binding protein n=1 Tax=Dictyobacter vulcani TaxID=2607529 RepID=A0A5J4KY28_9CHLR|nr:peptide ABC transporter substrate-binding protein [Dictyobacter vulcani]GER91440.1 peptide ABC transporter substrate-binding protein [Dictyobacter vulcani]